MRFLEPGKGTFLGKTLYKLIHNHGCTCQNLLVECEKALQSFQEISRHGNSAFWKNLINSVMNLGLL